MSGFFCVGSLVVMADADVTCEYSNGCLCVPIDKSCEGCHCRGLNVSKGYLCNGSDAVHCASCKLMQWSSSTSRYYQFPFFRLCFKISRLHIL